MSEWLQYLGLGMVWHGALILWAGRLPRLLRGAPAPEVEAGSAQAFMLFWLDQYSWIGFVLLIGGLALAVSGGLL